jgi:hypothetical protein
VSTNLQGVTARQAASDCHSAEKMAQITPSTTHAVEVFFRQRGMVWEFVIARNAIDHVHQNKIAVALDFRFHHERLEISSFFSKKCF